MISKRTEAFRRLLEALPGQIRKQAREAYRLWAQNPFHPSLHFKKVHASEDIWSARISDDYRAVGVRHGDKMIWFWIGSHAAYDKLLRQFGK